MLLKAGYVLLAGTLLRIELNSEAQTSVSGVESKFLCAALKRGEKTILVEKCEQLGTL